MAKYWPVAGGEVSSENVREQFVALVHTQFIRRCLAVTTHTTGQPQAIPSFSTEEQDVHTVPTSVLNGGFNCFNLTLTLLIEFLNLWFEIIIIF